MTAHQAARSNVKSDWLSHLVKALLVSETVVTAGVHCWQQDYYLGTEILILGLIRGKGEEVTIWKMKYYY